MPAPAAARRIAWIPGGSRGIGRATALHLARAGHDVAIGYHQDADAARETAQEAARMGVRAITVPGDMGNSDEVRRAHAAVQETLGTVSVFVASHGIYDRRESSAMDPAAWQRTIDVNLTGVLLAASHVLPAMHAAGWGRIILLGSIRGRTGSAHGALSRPQFQKPPDGGRRMEPHPRRERPAAAPPVHVRRDLPPWSLSPSRQAAGKRGLAGIHHLKGLVLPPGNDVCMVRLETSRAIQVLPGQPPRNTRNQSHLNRTGRVKPSGKRATKEFVAMV